MRLFWVKIFSSHPKIMTYDVILELKMTQLWPFSPKMSCFDLKLAFLTQLNPLMTFLTTYKLINLTKTTYRQIYIVTFHHKIYPRRHFCPQNDPKWHNFDNFHQGWPILFKLTTLMTFLTKFISINLKEKIVRNF